MSPGDGRPSRGGGTRARAARLAQGQATPVVAPAGPADPADPAETAGTETAPGPAAASRPAAPPAKARPRAAAPVTRRRSPPRSERADPGSDPTEAARLAALGEERDFLLSSLRDLEAEHDAGDVDDGDYAALGDDYTARAAAVIRAMETHQVRRQPAPPERSMTRRILVGALVVILAVSAGVLVAQWSGQRGSGDTITGGVRGDTHDDLLAARQQSANGKYLDAIKSYDKVLALDPANIEALAYKGWMLRIVSTQASGSQRRQLQAEALASLQQALRASPTDGTSLVFMAVLLGDLGRPQDALNELAKVSQGQLPSFMSGTVDQFRAQMQAQVAAASTTTTG